MALISHLCLLLVATLTDSSQNNAYAFGVAGLVAPFIGIAILGFLSKCIVSSHVDKLRHHKRHAVFFFVFSSACCCPVCCRSRCKACRPRVAPEKEVRASGRRLALLFCHPPALFPQGLATRILCQATAAQTYFALCALLVIFLGAGAVSWSKSLGAGFNFTFQGKEGAGVDSLRPRPMRLSSQWMRPAAVINFANILSLTNSSIGGPLLDAAYGINASVGVLNDRVRCCSAPAYPPLRRPAPSHPTPTPRSQLIADGVFSTNSSSGISDIQKGTKTLISVGHECAAPLAALGDAYL